MDTRIETTGARSELDGVFPVDPLMVVLIEAWGMIEAAEPSQAKRKERWEAFLAKMAKAQDT